MAARMIRPSRTRSGWLALAALALLAGCSSPTSDRRGAVPDSGRARPESVAVAPPPDTVVRHARYRTIRLARRGPARDLWKALGPERFLLALKVNRRDSLHLRPGDSVVVAVDSSLTLLDLAPFPRELPAARDSAKLMLVSRRVQAWAAYQRGRLERWGPTSTGRESLQTPAGLYHTNWKDRDRLSTFNDEWRLEWYVNLENYLGISFHLYDLPGYPASHSCVRLLLDDARWIYGWCDSWTLDPDDRRRVVTPGTPVVVFGQYAFGRKAPWRNLAADSSATDVPLFEIEAALRSVTRPVVTDSLKRATLLGLAARRDSARAPAPPAPR